MNMQKAGRRNLSVLYTYTAAAGLWFDGGLWLIYWQHRGVSLFEVGMLEAVLHVACIASDVPLGVFADRVGWKIALACSSLCGVLYTCLALVSHGFWLAALAFAFRGFQVTLANGSDASIAYESSQWAGWGHRYLTISGRIFAVALVSSAVAESLGGTLAHWSWSVLYLAYTASNLAAFVIVLWIQEPRIVTGQSNALEAPAEKHHLSLP